MTLEVFLAFAAASSLLLFMPGPTILLVVSYALARGSQSAFYTITGVLLGDAVAMGLSLAGVGALLMASAQAFFVMKTVGACYLVYLWIQMWRRPALVDDNPLEPSDGTERAMMMHAFTVTALNPKSGMFFVAFFPQFMDASRSLGPQIALLGGTFTLLALASVTVYALAAAEIHRAVRSPRIARFVNRLGGSALVAAGLVTATLRQGA